MGVQSPYGFVQHVGRSTGASCAANIGPAADAAYAAGVRLLWLPANCTWIPTGNALPANLGVIGASLQTSIIASDDLINHDVSLGPHSWVQNVGLQGHSCTLAANPPSTVKVCPAIYHNNISDSSISLWNWSYEFSLSSGSQSTGPNGAVSTDIPLMSIGEGSNGGDGIYVGASGPNTSGIRMVPSGSGAMGFYILPGWNGSTGPVGGNLTTYAIFDKDMTNSASQFGSIYIDRQGDGTNVSESIHIGDADATGNSYTRPGMTISLGHQTAGDFINLFQGTTAFTGNGIEMNFGNNGGSFTGNYILLHGPANSNVFTVGPTGITRATAFITGTLGSGALTPPTGSVSAVENLDWSAAGDQSVRAQYHLAASGNTSAAIRPTTDGTGTATNGNCGNLTLDNKKAVLHDIVLNATDETTPGNDYAWFLPAGQLTRYTGTASSLFHAMGSAVTSSNGSVTGASVSATVDATHACLNLSFTPPTGNTDTWRVVASFLADQTQ